MESLIFSLALIQGLCIATDRLLLNRHKGELYNKMLLLWDRLFDTSAPNLHKFMAKSIYGVLKKIVFTSTSGSKRFNALIDIFGKLCFISICFSLIAYILSRVIFQDESVIELFCDNKQAFWILTPTFLMFNALFDALTILVSYKIIKIMMKSNIIVSILLIFLDLIITSVLAYFSIMSSGVYFAVLFVFSKPDEYGFNLITFSSLSKLFLDTFQSIMFMSDSFDSMSPILTLLAWTTLFPTITYLIIYIILALSKTIMVALRGIVLYFIEKATEVDNPNRLIVFTLAGTVINVLILSIKVVYELIT